MTFCVSLGVALASGPSALALSLGRGPLTLPLSTQVNKWVTPTLKLGVTQRWTSIPFSGSGEGGVETL